MPACTAAPSATACRARGAGAQAAAECSQSAISLLPHVTCVATAAARRRRMPAPGKQPGQCHAPCVHPHQPVRPHRSTHHQLVNSPGRGLPQTLQGQSQSCFAQRCAPLACAWRRPPAAPASARVPGQDGQVGRAGSDTAGDGEHSMCELHRPDPTPLTLLTGIRRLGRMTGPSGSSARRRFLPPPRRTATSWSAIRVPRSTPA